MGFALCALVMYVLWWHKPFDVEHRTIVPFYDNEESYGCDEEDRLSTPSAVSKYRVPEVNAEDFVDEYLGLFATFQSSSPILFLSATAFSALHVAAWNWTFPSPITRNFWRVFSVAATGAPLIPLLASSLTILTREFPSGTGAYSWLSDIAEYLYMRQGNSNLYAGLLGISVYIISRLGLLVLIFYSFSSMPASVYETVDWTKYLPHFS